MTGLGHHPEVAVSRAARRTSRSPFLISPRLSPRSRIATPLSWAEDAQDDHITGSIIVAGIGLDLVAKPVFSNLTLSKATVWRAWPPARIVLQIQGRTQ